MVADQLLALTRGKDRAGNCESVAQTSGSRDVGERPGVSRAAGGPDRGLVRSTQGHRPRNRQIAMTRSGPAAGPVASSSASGLPERRSKSAGATPPRRQVQVEPTASMRRYGAV
jgi:hypothetical protein